MSRLVLTVALLNEVRATLLASPIEACAVLLGTTAIAGDKLVRLVVREAVYPKEDDYEVRTEIAARLKPAFVAVMAQRARKSGETLVFAHSHPFPLNSFSAIDDAGERALADFLADRMPETKHAALLVTPEVTIAREIGTDRFLRVCGVGETLSFGDEPLPSSDDAKYDRQVRMFGRKGQQRLANLRIGIVGLGGTGSVVLEQLIHLGVRNYCLLDPDTADESNLNRLVGATDRDVGRSKVSIAADMIRRSHPSAIIDALDGSVLVAKTGANLLDVDFLFCCTDSQGSRSVLNQLAYQYLIPAIDLGVSIVASQQGITHLAGRTNMLAPGLGCFVCGNLLNPEAVRVDLLTDFERNADPYVMGAREPAPAVISLNSTVASMAVTMFMAAVLGIPSTARYINYNGLTGTSRPAAISQHPKCVVCSPRGSLARGNSWPMPGRLD